MFEKPRLVPRAEKSGELSPEQERVIQEAYQLHESNIEAAMEGDDLSAMRLIKESQAKRDEYLRRMGISKELEAAYRKKHEQD